MSYEVRCECGKAYPVGAADAGVSFPCACGREVSVPALHELRLAAGEQAVSPALQIQAMLLNNELPGTRDCVNCGSRTDHLVRVSVVCERVSVDHPTHGKELIGCLLFGVLGALIMRQAGSGKPVERGREVAFVLPVRVCEACAFDRSSTALG